MKAISILQPWAWLVVNGHKDIENRSWLTHYRGPVAIHTGQKSGRRQTDNWCYVRDRFPHIDMPALTKLPRGGIVGVATIVDCIDRSDSPWFFGRYGFVLKDARPTEFRPCDGWLGLFDVPDELVVL